MIMLSHTDDLVTRPYEMATLLSHMEDLLTHPHDIRIVAISYVALDISSVWHNNNWCFIRRTDWCAILIAHQIVMAKHGGSCVHFSGISTCGRTSRETVSHPQCPPLPTLCKISLPIYVIVTNKLLQPLTTTWYDSLVLSISLLKI